LAIGGNVSHKSIFARKNYFYPDLPKGYQISQFEIPVVVGGSMPVVWEDASGKPQERVIRLTRAHLEEDAGKSLHEDFHGATGIDLNRAGTPLLEIVTEPDMRSAREAVAYAKALHGLVTWLGICDGNMQEGSFRCDANVSVRPVGQSEFGTRCEIKNLNSFKFMERAIDFEVRRQIELIEDGGKVRQETRLYDPDKDETRSMRSKEDANDYRYFPDPDLPPLLITPEQIAATRSRLPELPNAMRERLQAQYGLSPYDAVFLTATLGTAKYFEAALRVAGSTASKPVANWVAGELAAGLNREGIEIEYSPVSAEQLGTLVARIQDGTLSSKTAKEVFGILWDKEMGDVDAIIEARGLKQLSDTGAIEKIIDEVLAANPKSVEEFHGGKEKAFNALVGQVMKASKGKANPSQVNELLTTKLKG
jgi:aspartyl-tRNA(Asn)/glutamyl-tRNA(Gln) amidotransferase subunit B